MWRVEPTRRATSSGDDQLHGSGGGRDDFATTAAGRDATLLATRDKTGGDMVRAEYVCRSDNDAQQRRSLAHAAAKLIE